MRGGVVAMVVAQVGASACAIAHVFCFSGSVSVDLAALKRAQPHGPWDVAA
jgi:hypothetical protein